MKGMGFCAIYVCVTYGGGEGCVNFLGVFFLVGDELGDEIEAVRDAVRDVSILTR